MGVLVERVEQRIAVEIARLRSRGNDVVVEAAMLIVRHDKQRLGPRLRIGAEDAVDVADVSLTERNVCWRVVVVAG